MVITRVKHALIRKEVNILNTRHLQHCGVPSLVSDNCDLFSVGPSLNMCPEAPADVTASFFKFYFLVWFGKYGKIFNSVFRFCPTEAIPLYTLNWF